MAPVTRTPPELHIVAVICDGVLDTHLPSVLGNCATLCNAPCRRVAGVA